ncbi:MAG: hypothetical protein JWN95_2247 [Frankiales bacterium]|nr:hypothetical protein [Frankiales bacterium]
MSTEKSTQAATGAGQPDAAADEAATAQSAPSTAAPSEAADVKAQFRAALERKRGQQGDTHAGAGPDATKIHGEHSRAAAKRQFRRKSGG